MSGTHYYHARGTPLDVTELRYGWRRMMKSDPEGNIDDLFEATRKGRSFERNTAIFMIGLSSGIEVTASHFDNIGVQSAAYIYRLAPKSPACKHDWYGARELHARHPPVIGGKKVGLSTLQPDPAYCRFTDEQIAESYWGGEASYAPRWEYLTDAAIVLASHIHRSAGSSSWPLGR
jgi:hypothetical protein